MTPLPSTPAPPPRSALRLVLDPAFGGLFWGKLFSVTGVMLHGMAATITVYDATGSATAAGLVSVAQFAPQLLLSPISGSWADRGHTRAQVVIGRLMCILGSGMLAVVLAVADPRGWSAAGVVLGASAVVGMGFVVGGPAMQTVVPRLVSTAELPTAMVLNTTPAMLGRVLGPVLGALALTQIGATWAFALAAASHVGLALAMALIKLPDETPPAGKDLSVGAALRYVRRHRALGLTLLAMAAAAAGSEPTVTLAPALADAIGGGTAMTGVLAAAFGVGSVLSLVLVGPVGRRVGIEAVTTAGLALMAAGTAIALVPVAHGTVAGFLVSGIGYTGVATAASTLIQLRVPAHLRGRVMALWMVAFVGTRPLAALAAGGLADLAGAQTALVAIALLMAVSAWLCRPSQLTQHSTSSRGSAPTVPVPERDAPTDPLPARE